MHICIYVYELIRYDFWGWGLSASLLLLLVVVVVCLYALCVAPGGHRSQRLPLPAAPGSHYYYYA